MEKRQGWRGTPFQRCAPCLFLFMAAYCLMLNSALKAQDFGSIVGTVTDPSGAAVPGVSITVTNMETSAVVRNTVTNAEGNYAIPALLASRYSIEAKAQGFKTVVQSDIILDARTVVRIDLTLQLGAINQEVTVSAPVVHLQTESATQSQTISGQEVAQIDINGRNFIQLATLVPGAASQLPSFNTPVGVTANAGIAFNGEQPDHNIWYVDGQENYDRGCGGCITIIPDQDAIQEFKVETGNTQSDSGFGTAGHVQMEIKGGTSQFHGEAFEFVRNTDLDASTFFANASSSSKPKLDFNNFGFNVGGPIPIPGHEKKTFFFYEGDWRKLVQAQTIVAPGVPPAWTQGNFSSYQSPILDHTKPVTLPNGTTGYTPFSGNQIPTTMLNSNAQILGAPNLIFNAPNSPGGVLFTGIPSVPTDVNEEIVRIDHNFSDKTSLMVHYIRDGVNQTFPTSLWSSDTYPTVGTDFLNAPQSVVLKIARTINPTLLNEFMVAYQRQPLTLEPTGTFSQPSGLTIQSLYPGTNTDNRIPTIGLSGPALGVTYDPASWPWTNVSNTWTYHDQLTKTTGNHTFTFGGEYMRFFKEQELFGDTQGDFTFNGNATAGNYLGPGGQILSTSGNEYADFMLGQAYSYNELQVQTMPAYLVNNVGLWFGDSWKVRKGLTLTYGLRWEEMPHAYEIHNNVSSFRPSLYDPADAPQLNPDGSIVPGTGNLLNGMALAGKNGIPRGLVGNHWKLFEPRIGFAWQPFSDGKTVVRGGYGLFYERIQGNDIYNVAPNPPFSNTPLIFNTSLTNPGIVPGTIFPGNVQAYDPHYLEPYSEQWNLGIQRQINPSILLSVSYVGTSGTHLQDNRNINQPLQPVPSGSINNHVPYLGWAQIGWYENSVSSNYNSLQVSLRTTQWHGLTAGLAYTWSHCLDYSDGDVPGFIQNAYNIGSEYGNCGFNLPQILIMNYVYSLPMGRSATGLTRAAIGGWQLSGITTFQSGAPFTVGFPGDPAEVGGGNYRANIIGNPNAGSGIHTPQEWFNISAFAPIPTGQFGNGARDAVYGAGINNFDVSLFKNFTKIPLPGKSEGGTLQFRVEFFNLFNHTQFNSYLATYGTAGFGEPNSTRDPREIQIGLKFMF